MAAAAPGWEQPLDHQLMVSIQIDYTLERLVATGLGGRNASADPRSKHLALTDLKGGALVRKRRTDEYLKLFIVYTIGKSFESKSEPFTVSSNQLHYRHDLLINRALITEIAEHGISVKLYEVVRESHALVNATVNGTHAVPAATATMMSRATGEELSLSVITAMARRRPLKTDVRNPGDDFLTAMTSRAAAVPLAAPAIHAAAHADGTTVQVFRPARLSPAEQHNAWPRTGSLDELQARVTLPNPHPHHHQHPERHLSPHLLALTRGPNKALRTRSQHAHAALALLRPRTPPSPHHAAGVVETIMGSSAMAGFGGVPGRIGASGVVRPYALLNGKEVFPAEVRRQAKHRALSPAATRLGANTAANASTSASTITSTALGPASKRLRNHDGRKKTEVRHVLMSTLRLNPAGLFESQLTLAGSFPCMRGLTACRFGLRLDSPLLNDAQMRLFNPLIVQFTQILGLPAMPTPYTVLDAQAAPIVLTHRFFGQDASSRAVTSAVAGPRATDITLEGMHVVLVGLLPLRGFHDYLSRETLVVHVHDRQDKQPTRVSPPGAPMRVGRNPYGVAEFDLSELLRGETRIETAVRILPMPYVAELRHATLPAANWVESGSLLVARFRLSHPLKTVAAVARTRAMQDAAAITSLSSLPPTPASVAVDPTASRPSAPPIGQRPAERPDLASAHANESPSSPKHHGKSRSSTKSHPPPAAAAARPVSRPVSRPASRAPSASAPAPSVTARSTSSTAHSRVPLAAAAAGGASVTPPPMKHGVPVVRASSNALVDETSVHLLKHPVERGDAPYVSSPASPSTTLVTAIAATTAAAAAAAAAAARPKLKSLLLRLPARQRALVGRLDALVTRMNRAVLKCADNAELFSTRLSPAQRHGLDPQFDVVTGYHIYDRDVSLVLLEGWAPGNFATMAASVVSWLNEDPHATAMATAAATAAAAASALSSAAVTAGSTGKPRSAAAPMATATTTAPPSLVCVTVDAPSLARRSWIGLVAGIAHIQLEPRLAEIVQDNALYIRTKMPVQCFQAVMLLHRLATCDVTRSPLLDAHAQLATGGPSAAVTASTLRLSDVDSPMDGGIEPRMLPDHASIVALAQRFAGHMTFDGAALFRGASGHRSPARSIIGTASALATAATSAQPRSAPSLHPSRFNAMRLGPTHAERDDTADMGAEVDVEADAVSLTSASAPSSAEVSPRRRGPRSLPAGAHIPRRRVSPCPREPYLASSSGPFNYSMQAKGSATQQIAAWREQMREGDDYWAYGETYNSQLLTL